MNKRCKHIGKDGFRCGSHAFNLYKDDIEQGDLCDVHYWQTKAQRTWAGLSEDDKVLINYDANYNQFMTAGEYADRVQQLTEARLKDLNT